MPIYEFKCNTCKAEFETIVGSYSEVDTVKCEQCGSSDVARVVSAVNSKVQKTGSIPMASGPGCRPGSRFS